MARLNENGYTPVQQCLIDVLSNGLPHDRAELLRGMQSIDSQANLSNLGYHIHMLRRTLRARGEDIVCELWDGYPHYRHIRLLVWPLPSPIPKQCRRKRAKA